MPIGSKINEKLEKLFSIVPAFIHGSIKKPKNVRPWFILLFSLELLLLSGTSIDFQVGFCSGFAGSDSSLQDLIEDLIPEGIELNIKKRDWHRGPCDGPHIMLRVYNTDRSRRSICLQVMHYVPQLRNLYLKRLKETPGLRGKVTVKFKIVETGNIISSELVESTLNDPEFVLTVISAIKLWVFPKIDTSVDTAAVTIPFVFNQ